MSCSDVIGTETVEVSFAILEVISVTYKSIFSEGNRIYFVEIRLPKTKPLILEIIYGPPNQSNFLEITNANFDKLDTDMKESYIFGDFNKNMYQINNYIVVDNNAISSKLLSLLISHNAWFKTANKIPDPCNFNSN